MRITFLGTSSGTPSRTRNVTSIALQLIQQGSLWLFDCGEATQHQILRSPLRLSQLEKIFITHLHGDHLFGVMGLLASRSLQNGGTTPVTLYGPTGLADYVQAVIETTRTNLAFPVQVETVAPGQIYEDENLRVVCGPLKHRLKAFGYAVIEKDQPGHFQAEQAKALGIPPGPLYGRLKMGETITLEDGRIINGAELVGPTRPGRKVVYCSDTIYTPNSVELARNADVLIHESTYLQEDLDLAERAQHSTATMAAQVAKQAGVKTLILTHFSPRYEAEGGSRLDKMLAEAQAIFPNTLLAYDFWSYEIPRH
jgi:ribonuclease Z